MRVVLAFCFLMIGLQINAQHLTGKVIDNATNLPISKVLVKNSSAHSTSLEDGSFSLNRDDSNISFSHLAYETLVLRNDHIDRLDSIFLTPRVFNLEEIQISSDRKITSIPAPDNYKPKSMGQIGENLMIFFTQKYRSKESKVNLYDLAGNKISTIEVDFKIEGMIHTCDNKYYLVDKDFAYLVGLEGLTLKVEHKITVDQLKGVYDNCIFSHGNQYVFENLKLNNLIGSYTLVDDFRTRQLRRIIDPKLLEYYKEEYAFVNQEEGAAIMQDVSAHEADKIRDVQERRDFLNQVVFKKHEDNFSAFCNDKWLLFNCQQDSLHIYNKKGQTLQDRAIEYPSKVYDLICDYQKKNVYALTKKGPYKHIVWRLTEAYHFEKVLTIKADHIFDLFIDQGQIYYLKSRTKGNFLERSFCFESL